MELKRRKNIINRSLITKKNIIVFTIFIMLLIALPFIISGYVKNASSGYIVSEKDAQNIAEIDCILVLGAGLKSDGTPSHMLQDRMDMGIALYFAEAAPKLLLSGDHGQIKYDEVNAMKRYAIEAGIPVEDIFLDHAGFSTYESMYRARDIFEANRILVVTQDYHQYRALYIARGLGIEAFGVCSDQRTYIGQSMRDIREIIARDKDFFSIIFKPKPTYLGDVIPITGSGIKSQD